MVSGILSVCTAQDDKDLFQIRLEALKISLNLTALLSGVSVHGAHLANYRFLRQRIHKGFDVLSKPLEWTLFDKIVLTSQIIVDTCLEHLVLEKLKYVYKPSTQSNDKSSTLTTSKRTCNWRMRSTKL